jgi:hypothetical protein
VWRGLKDHTPHIPPSYILGTPITSLLNDLSNLIWRLEPGYQKIDLTNVTTLNYLCRIRAEKLSIGTREELEKHDNYIRQMWKMLKQK